MRISGREHFTYPEQRGVNPRLTNSWATLQQAGSKFVKTDINYLEKFAILTSENQLLIAKFSDAASGSTLTKFLDDCDADPVFLSYINNPENALEVKGFLAHKEGMLTADENLLLSEILENSDELPNSNVRKWLEYGENMAAFKANRLAGTAFGNLMKTELANAASEAYIALKEHLNKLDLNIEEYSIYSQVQLCLGGDCITKGNYWIPDFVLVAKRTDALDKEYLEAIIVDAKLSGSTGWTPNQNAARSLSDWTVKSINENALIKGDKVVGFDLSAKVVKKGDFIKIYNESGIIKTK